LGKSQKIKKVPFYGEFIYYNIKQGIFATGYSFSKKHFFTKWRKLSRHREEEDEGDRPFGYKPRENHFFLKRNKKV
jgi:hypothetical protein